MYKASSFKQFCANTLYQSAKKAASIMKPNIHPSYHNITVKLTDGSCFETRSTYGEEGSVLQLDIDCRTHPAWTGGGALINEKTGKVAKFKNKFGNIGFAPKTEEKSSEADVTAAPKAEPAPEAKTKAKAAPKKADAPKAKK